MCGLFRHVVGVVKGLFCFSFAGTTRARRGLDSGDRQRDRRHQSRQGGGFRRETLICRHSYRSWYFIKSLIIGAGGVGVGAGGCGMFHAPTTREWEGAFVRANSALNAKATRILLLWAGFSSL